MSDSMHERITEALRRHAVDEALTLAREWAFRQPEDPQAHRWLGVAWQYSGDPAAALNSIDRALALAPEEADLHMVRASVLLAARQVDPARAALAAASQLNPNQFEAYLAQGQLAFARGDLDEAERQNRLAARVRPEHPRLAVIDALVALRRGQPQAALQRLAPALRHAGEDLQVRYAAGFAYMANQHWAFAEQAFRGVVEQIPDARTLRVLLAELLAQQGRLDEAADELEPLLADPSTATPAVLRLAGGLRMDAGQVEQALPLLRQALAGLPGDRPTLQALIDAWDRLGRQDEAHGALEAALATTVDSSDLWQARLAIEPDDAGRRAVVDRWIAAMPQSTLPLEVRMLQQQEAGDTAAADATAWRILDLAPEHAAARMQLLDTQMARDPAEAVAQLRQWLLLPQSPASRLFLLGMLGLGHDRAGQPAQAVAAWSEMQQDVAQRRAPLPPMSAPREDWPELAARPDNPPTVLFLWGAPGSGVDRLATVMLAAGEPFRADRFSPEPPGDGFQAIPLIEGLASGKLDPARVVARWRQALPQRGRADGDCFDWLVWWDNVLLLALRPHLREAGLVFAIRDPRDMLLEWLAFGSVVPFAFPGAEAAADWLARMLEQIASLHEHEWFPHRIVRTDAIGHDPALAAAAMNQVLGVQLPVPATIGPPRFPGGHWRDYGEVLAAPFARLGDIATRLGYPAT